MKYALNKIALGGGCHWCTEAVFQSLKGVVSVEQGYIASLVKHSAFSEGVIVHFNANIISLKTLIEIHLYTHKCTSNHSMREKYRSAVYVFSEAQKDKVEVLLKGFQSDFNNEIITKVYPFSRFKASRDEIQDYYQKNPKKPFCEKFIDPKLMLLMDKFSDYVNTQKIGQE